MSFWPGVAILSALAFAMVAHPALAGSDWQMAAQPTRIDGLRVVRAEVTLDLMGYPALLIRFDKPSGKRIHHFTAAHIEERVEFLVDGETVSAPYLWEAIRGVDVQVSGTFTHAELRALADRLQKGGTVELRSPAESEPP